MSLPPQEPPRGPPPLNVSPKSHKIKKTTAGASSSQHPHAPPPLEDYLARLEQKLMSDDGLEEMPQLPDDLLQLENLLMQFLRADSELQRAAFWEQIQRLKEREQMQQQNPLPLIPPEVVSTVANTQSVLPMNEFPRARVGNMSWAEVQRRVRSLVTFLEQRRRRKERKEMQQQNPLPTIPPEVVSTVADTQTVPSLNQLGSASNILPNQPVNFPPAPTAVASRFLPRTPESFPAGASSFLPGPSDPSTILHLPEGYHSTTSAATGRFIIPSPPEDYRAAPVDPPPDAWRSIMQGPPGYFCPQLSGSLPYIPTPAFAEGRSILQGPPGYFPDESGSFLPRTPDISAAAAARSICPRPADCSPSASSSAASTPSLEFSLPSGSDGSLSPITEDSTTPPPDPTA